MAKNNHTHVSIASTKVASNIRMSTTSPPNFLAVVEQYNICWPMQRLVVQVQVCDGQLATNYHAWVIFEEACVARSGHT